MPLTETRFNTFDAREIANKLLQLSNAENLPLTSMQLLKLVYLVHGWSLAMFDEPIVRNNPQAWQYGPVYPSIYKAVKKSGSSPVSEMITKPATGEVYFPEDISQPKLSFLSSILSSYGRKPAFELSSITHRDGTPWHKTYHEIGKYQDIPLDFMREHFQRLARERNINTNLYRDMEAA